MLRSKVVLIAAALVAAAPALGNDTTAELASGGLIFVRNENVEMRSEELMISAKEISVRYRFYNKSDKDVTVLVAFPMPDIKVEEADGDIAVPTDDPVNFLAFATTVNGQPAVTQVEQRVIAGGIDRTQLLRSLGIPLAPHLSETDEALDRLPRARWDDLIRVGLAEIETSGEGRDQTDHLVPRWTLQTTFYWEQTFRAKADTVVEHRYQPSVGGSVQTGLGDLELMKEDWFDEYEDKYCLDKDFLSAVERSRPGNGTTLAPYSEQRIEYILKTGANWSGPIGDFRVVVDKGDADSLVSFCGEAVRKIGPTQFEFRKTNYLPDSDFAVLILKKMPAP